MIDRRRFVFFGLSITSSWGNGHATTYRALLRALSERGHDILFLERDVPWYAENRDLPSPSFCRVELYRGLLELHDRFTQEVRDADVVIVGSYVPAGIAVADWVLATARGLCAFYDIDTPVTLAGLQSGDCEYLSPAQLSQFSLYLSFTGGAILGRMARLGARAPRPLYCAVDPLQHFPEPTVPRWVLGYLGTYAPDRQPALESLLLMPARRRPHQQFCVAGPMYPETIAWPSNVTRLTHVPPGAHRDFYCAQELTLNITRREMLDWGWSPSVRLFEAGACGVPVVSDAWPGLEQFFAPGREILIARDSRDVKEILDGGDERKRRLMGERARARVLAEHTAAHRAEALEGYLAEVTRRQGIDRRSTWPRSL